MNNPSRLKMPSPRVIYYWLNILFLVVTCGLIVWLGPRAFSKTTAPSIYKIILIILAGFSSLVMIYVTHRSRGNTLITAVLRSLIIAIVSFGLSFLGGTVLTQSIIPPGSVADVLKQADSLMTDGEYSGAAALGQKCISLADEPLEINACNKLIANSNFEIAEIQAKNGNCIAANKFLEVGLNSALLVNDNDLVAKFTERKEKYAVSCVIQPTATNLPDNYKVEVLRNQNNNNRAWIDFRILNNNEYIKTFDQSNFQLTDTSGKTVDFSFENKTSDDPVCVIAVLDNSGSIKPGLEGMKRAAQTLNSLRKDNDELGFVLFGNTESTTILQNPSKGSIDITKIDGSGGNTALWTGLYLAFQAADKCDSDNRYIIVVTDGRNTEIFEETNDYAAAELFRGRAKSENIKICPIGIKTEDLDEKSLYSIAEGCNYYLADNSDIVSDKFTEIFGYVRDFYRIEFSPMFIKGTNSIELHILKDMVPIGEKDVEFGQ